MSWCWSTVGMCWIIDSREDLKGWDIVEEGRFKVDVVEIVVTRERAGRWERRRCYLREPNDTRRTDSGDQQRAE